MRCFSKLSLAILAVGISVILISKPILADTTTALSTRQVVQATLAALPSCMHYKVIGLCFWRVCDGSICWVEKTLKVDQYLPDAVASVYRKENSNPWDYANRFIDPLAQQAGQAQIKNILGFDMGFGNQSNSLPQEQNTHFKEVDLMGNPALTIFRRFSDMFLPSQATPFVPYYLSQMDSYLWRSPLIETALYPSSLIPGLHVVGSIINNWGNVYPRTGFIDQPADGKAAAVIAQRAADIATRSMQPHIYKPLNTNNSCGDHCNTWEAKENDTNTQWQMIYPITQNQCTIFGKNDLGELQPWGQDAAQKGDGDYSWILWRHYKGCVPGHGTYIGSVDF